MVGSEKLDNPGEGQPSLRGNWFFYLFETVDTAVFVWLMIGGDGKDVTWAIPAYLLAIPVTALLAKAATNPSRPKAERVILGVAGACTVLILVVVMLSATGS